MKKLVISLLLFSNAIAQPFNLPLNNGWNFRKLGDKEWLPATVPGTVHTDLLNNKKIPDPFYGTNENLVQWVEDSAWEYETKFSCTKQILAQQNVELVFEGLDTYAKVYLNDSLIFSADNMFRTWNIECRKYLKPENELRIVFESAVRKGKEASKSLTYTLPGDEKVFTRKAQYQYGWDWGPRLVTCGIWRPVTLIAWNKIKIENVQAIQQNLTDSIAEVSLAFDVTCHEEGVYIFSGSANESHVEKQFHLIHGRQIVTISEIIRNPKLWWPNGIGTANLYSFDCSVSQKNKSLDSKRVNIGLRSIELVQEKDVKGKSFYFKVNGIPVFMKGANWIPADNFLPRVAKEKYRSILTATKDANMNMLRVWGGGVYESDDFYSLCDSLGILVWQDFMFACAMYPGDSAFTANVTQEVKDNIVRLRNHPCLALWCGNNEIDEGWNNWGWQEQYKYSSADSIKIWSDYINLFEKTLPDAVKENDSRNYISSSPMHGWGRKESLLEGDCHYWGVWWAMEPLEIYGIRVGRFMSEYGMQGMPALSTFKKFCSADDLSLTSDAVKNHQKHPTGYETIQQYLESYYRKPAEEKGFENYIYVSQVLQAEAVKRAMEAHRSAKPYCMGTLYWQFNDCWPVTSWSGMDYYQTPKALQYIARNAYAKYLVCAENRTGLLSITVVSDDTAKLNAQLKLQVIDFDGNVLKADSGNIAVSNEKSEVVFKSSLKQFLSNTYYASSFLKMEMTQNGKLLAENVFYFNKPKDLLLNKADIKYSILKTGKNEFSLSLSSETLAKSVFINFGETKVELSDNYFDLLPKEAKAIIISSAATLEELQKAIRIKSLVDSY